MRRAPPVGLTCSDGGAWRAAQAVLYATAAAAFGYWVGRLSALDAASAAAATAAVAAVAAGAAWCGLRQPPRRLEWDGEHWMLDGIACDPRPAIDLGGWLLVRAGRHWLALGRGACGAAWQPLRVALHAHRAVPQRA